MEAPLTLETHHASVPPQLEELIRRKASALDRFFQPILRCRVTVEGPGGHHRNGGLYGVRVHLTLPGTELAVGKQDNPDLETAIRGALDAAKRQIQDYARQLRKETKAHEPNPRGRIAELCPDEGYGFLETTDGREIYFHENSVLEPGFEDLGIGTEVRFVEEMGETGPQASTVERVGRT